jgi:beta-lactam-binding protein with PASTA domain
MQVSLRTKPIIAIAIAVILVIVISIVLLTRGVTSQVSVPSVVGESQSHAQTKLTNDGLRYLIEKVHRSTSSPPPDGTVISQDPRASARVDRGTEVKIVVYTY